MAELSTEDKANEGKTTEEHPSKLADANLASLKLLLNPISRAATPLNETEQPPPHLLKPNDVPSNAPEAIPLRRKVRSKSMVDKPRSRTMRTLRPSIAVGQSHEAPSYYPPIAQVTPHHPPLPPTVPYPMDLSSVPQYYAQKLLAESDGYSVTQPRYYPAYGNENAAYYSGYPGLANKIAIYSNSVAASPSLPSGSDADLAGQSTKPYARSPRLKAIHKMAERQRRFQLRSQFNELEQLLPDRNRTLRKTEVVDKAIQLIDELVKQREVLLREREELRNELFGIIKESPEP